MSNKEMRAISIAVLVAVACTWWAATSDFSPVKPQQERPVLRFLARVAKLGLWVMAFADPPPSDRSYVVHARMDAEGNRVLNHGQGW